MWKVIKSDSSSLEQTYKVGPLVGKLLSSSSLSEERIQELLNPTLRLTTSNAPCVVDCCERLLKAKKNHEKVFVGGDYDADGICSTAIMKDTLDRLGIKNGYYIPDRFKEGYGLSVKTVELAHERGYSLLLTVDNGVKAFEAIAKAKELGMDIIVTDHHRIEEEVKADIVVHPDYMEAQFATLSGAGVALEIARSLLGEVKSHIVFAAIAAIADVMPLWKETRTIVQVGLRYLAQGVVPSLMSLIAKGYEINERTVSFEIVPRLNSVGRMNDISNVNTLIPFLLSKNKEQIASYVMQLNLVNTRRKELSHAMYQTAIKMIENEKFILLLDESFHEGICGLVAGRIVDEYKRPTLVLSEKDGMLKGSGRSIKGLDLYQFFAEGFEELTSFGGHELAVGLGLKKEDYETFCKKVLDKIEKMEYEEPERVDEAIEIKMKEITFDSINELNILRPYPKELQKPIFAIHPKEMEEVFSTVKITKYRMKDGTNELDGILFPFRNVKVPETIRTVIGELSINRFRDQVSPQIDIIHVED